MHAEEGAHHVDVENPAEVCGRLLFHATEVNDPRVVDQDVHGAQGVLDGADDGLPVLFAGDIEVAVLSVGKFLGQGLSLVVQHVADGDPGAFRGQPAYM